MTDALTAPPFAPVSPRITRAAKIRSVQDAASVVLSLPDPQQLEVMELILGQKGKIAARSMARELNARLEDAG